MQPLICQTARLKIDEAPTWWYTSAPLTTTPALEEQGIMADSSLLAQRRTVKKFQEEIVYETGEFTADAEGRVWNKKGERAEHCVPSGYLQVRIQRGGIRYHTCAHRLVWRCLVGPIPHGMAINHKNGIKNDNRIDNLEVVTYSENTKHAYRTGLKDQHGQRNPAATVTDEQVEQIRKLYTGGGYTMKQVGEIVGVTFQYVSSVVRGQTRTRQGGAVIAHDCRHSVSERDAETGRFIVTPTELRVRQFPTEAVR